MPGRDGTGPESEGPMTGRGLGRCGGRRRRSGGQADDDAGTGTRRRRRRRARAGEGNGGRGPEHASDQIAALRQRLERLERQRRPRDPDPAA